MTSDAPPIEQPKLPFPLQGGETVLRLVRRHWLFLWPYVLFQAALGIVPVVFFALVLDAIDVMDDIGGIYWIVAAVWLVIWAVRALLAWYRYHHDVWAVTNQRLVDSYRRHPLHLRVATADLVNVQDMSVTRNGLLATMLDYGDVVCQTAAELPDFRLIGVPDPRSVQALIDRERDRERMRGR